MVRFLQYVQKLVFLKKSCFSSKSVKVANLPRNAYQLILSLLVNIFSTLILNFFAKSLKIFNLGNYTKLDEKRVFFFEKKNVFILLKGIFKIGGQKNAGGSWASCWIYFEKSWQFQRFTVDPNSLPEVALKRY